jgi:hypothetical protein
VHGEAASDHVQDLFHIGREFLLVFRHIEANLRLSECLDKMGVSA